MIKLKFPKSVKTEGIIRDRNIGASKVEWNGNAVEMDGNMTEILPWSQKKVDVLQCD